LIKELFKKSKEIALEGKNPIILDDSNKAFIVTEGRVEIFSVKLKNGQPFGHRTHIFTANPNDMLFGVDYKKHKKETVLLAIGIYGTKLAQLEKKELTQHLNTDTGRASLTPFINNWVTGLINGIAGRIVPKRYRSLEVMEEYKLEPQQSAMSKSGVLWIKQITGSTTYCSKIEISSGTDNGYIPVTGFGWLKTGGQETVLKVITTGDMLKDKRCFEYIESFNDLALSLILHNTAEFNEQLDKRMSDRFKQDNLYMKGSLNKLAEVLTPQKEEVISGSVGDDLLFLSCKKLGQYSGIDIKLPKGEERSLTAIANISRIRTRKVILEEGWWKSDAGPLLGYLEEDNRPVALLPRNKKAYELWDPINSKKQPVNIHLAGKLKPFAVTFYKPFPTEEITKWGLLKYGLKNTWVSDIVWVFVIGILGGLLGMVIPIATGLIFNTIIPQAARPQLLQLGMFLLISGLASFLFQVAKAINTIRIETRMDYSIQSAVWDRVMSLPVPFFRDYTAGDLAQRAISINTIRKTLSGSSMNSILAGIFSIFNLFLLFYYSKDLAITASILVLVAIATTLLLGYFGVRYQKVIAESDGKLSGFLLQLIFGISKIRVAGAEKRAFYLWADEFSKKRKFKFKAETVSNLFSIFNGVFPVICSMILYYFVVNSQKIVISTGNFLAFNAAFVNFLAAMLSFSQTYITIQSIVPLFERAKPILSTLPEYDENKAEAGELEGEIEVGHINFRYSEDAPRVLDNVSFSVRAGQFVALVGSSGSGKSTLLRLLLGFEEPESGAIYYDGLDLASLDIRSVRSQIGVVLQNGRLMSGDIFTNIIGASTTLSMDDAWEAAEMVAFGDDIREMPMGMFTMISEGGSTLSGGQIQRLLIARAIVNKPRIIFFDEATSALDNRTQEIVSQSLEKFNAARIAIAHRLSTIRNADKIVVLEAGCVVQAGTYDELINVEGTFKELAKRQLA